MDRGPNWIHGTLNNPIVDLAKATGTILCRSTEDTLVFDQDGSLFESDRVDECQELMWSIISDAFRASNERSDSISPEVSLKDFFDEQLRNKDLRDDDRRLVSRMGEMWGSFIGDTWESQSLKYFWLEECLDGGKSSELELAVDWPLTFDRQSIRRQHP